MEKDQGLPGPAEERNDDGGGAGTAGAAGTGAETPGPGTAGPDTAGGQAGADAGSAPQFVPPGGTFATAQAPYQGSSYTSPDGNPYAQVPPAAVPPGMVPPAGAPPVGPPAYAPAKPPAGGPPVGPPAYAPANQPALGQPAGYGTGPGYYPGYQSQQGYQGQPGYPGPGYPGQGQQGYQGQPGYPGPGYPGQPPRATPGKALGIAALSVAGSGLLISWIPFFNVVTFLLGAVALGLGIAGLVKGLRARNVARVLSGIALAAAVVSMIIAGSVTAVFVDSFRQAGFGQIEAESDGTIPDFAETPELEDFTFEVGDSYWDEILAAPAHSAGEEVQVGDYTVTLDSVDRDASAEVQERDPLAGAPDHNYVLFEFTTVYNGDDEGRLWLDLAPEFVGADSRAYSIMDCSMDLGVTPFDQPNLAKGETRTYEVCMDLPDEAIGGDSRMSLRMILAEQNEPVYWRLP